MSQLSGEGAAGGGEGEGDGEVPDDVMEVMKTEMKLKTQELENVSSSKSETFFPFEFQEIPWKHYRSFYTILGGPICAVESKSYDWNVRNIAKISPKMTKNCRF